MSNAELGISKDFSRPQPSCSSPQGASEARSPAPGQEQEPNLQRDSSNVISPTHSKPSEAGLQDATPPSQAPDELDGEEEQAASDLGDTAGSLVLRFPTPSDGDEEPRASSLTPEDSCSNRFKERAPTPEIELTFPPPPKPVRPDGKPCESQPDHWLEAMQERVEDDRQRLRDELEAAKTELKEAVTGVALAKSTVDKEAVAMIDFIQYSRQVVGNKLTKAINETADDWVHEGSLYSSESEGDDADSDASGAADPQPDEDDYDEQEYPQEDLGGDTDVSDNGDDDAPGDRDGPSSDFNDGRAEDGSASIPDHTPGDEVHELNNASISRNRGLVWDTLPRTPSQDSGSPPMFSPGPSPTEASSASQSRKRARNNDSEDSESEVEQSITMSEGSPSSRKRIKYDGDVSFIESSPLRGSKALAVDEGFNVASLWNFNGDKASTPDESEVDGRTVDTPLDEEKEPVLSLVLAALSTGSKSAPRLALPGLSDADCEDIFEDLQEAIKRKGQISTGELWSFLCKRSEKVNEYFAKMPKVRKAKPLARSRERLRQRSDGTPEIYTVDD